MKDDSALFRNCGVYLGAKGVDRAKDARIRAKKARDKRKNRNYQEHSCSVRNYRLCPHSNCYCKLSHWSWLCPFSKNCTRQFSKQYVSQYRMILRFCKFPVASCISCRRRQICWLIPMELQSQPPLWVVNRRKSSLSCEGCWGCPIETKWRTFLEAFLNPEMTLIVVRLLGYLLWGCYWECGDRDRGQWES